MMHSYVSAARAALLTGMARLGGSLALLAWLLPGAAQAQSVTITGPAGSGSFGSFITVLTNGNYVVTDLGYDNGAVLNVGAVYLYRGSDNVLLSTLTGTTANDQVGSGGVTALPNGNYVVNSGNWDNAGVVDAGAVTWGSGTAGVSGAVSAANSLVGSAASDNVGSSGNVIALPNGNYVVRSGSWDNAGEVDAGAVTWGSGTAGVSGAVSAANSLVGTTANDLVGSSIMTVLVNGNYVVNSGSWNNLGAVNAGAVTWGNGTAGTSGAVSAANSLVGSAANDNVGGTSVTALPNGGYAVRSPNWDNAGVVDAGAVSLGTAAGTTNGPVTACNSVAGSVASQGPTLVFAYNATTDKLLVGLSAENKVVIGVGEPPAPTGAATQTVASGATVADLMATGTAIRWYPAASGGPALASTTPLVNGTTYYATQTEGGCESTARLAVRVVFPAVISSFSPASGVAGTPVTLTGTDLSGATVVTVNGVAVTPTSVTATTLDFVVPAGASATQSITVTTPGGTSIASTAFTVRLLAVATGISPAPNALTAPRASSALAVGFSEPVTAASASTIKVFSAQAGGLKAGTVTSSGSTASYTSTLPAALRDFRAGETVSVTVPASVQGAGGLALSAPSVYQFTTATTASPGTFAGGTDFGAGTQPYGVALGDVSGDGVLDLVVANDGSSSASVRLGTGTGSFGSQTDYATGSQPDVVALGDVNGDGALDLVTANFGGGSASVLLNSGTGTFSGRIDYATGTQTRSVALGDVNGDGALDFVTATYGGSSVSVRLNSGTGTFGLNTDYPTGINPATVALGDLNGDGLLDVVTSNFSSNSTTVLLNSGTGTFGSRADYPAGVNPLSVALGDVNGDGKLDMATANYSSNNASVLLGTGTGSFGTRADYATGSTPAGVAPADLNGDGTLDLATANNGASTASVLLGLAPVPLPVELTAFTATAESPAAVRLAWATASEKNSARFEVERSADGCTFAPIGTVAAAGSSSAPRAYQLLDAKLPGRAATLYYRLRQVDADGSFRYSPVRTVALTGAAAGLALFPNPATTGATLTGVPPGTAVTVYDALGRLVTVATADASGTAALALPAGLPTGVYVVRAGNKAVRLTVE